MKQLIDQLMPHKEALVEALQKLITDVSYFGAFNFPPEHDAKMKRAFAMKAITSIREIFSNHPIPLENIVPLKRCGYSHVCVLAKHCMGTTPMLADDRFACRFNPPFVYAGFRTL